MQKQSHSVSQLENYETNETAFYQRNDFHRPHNPEVAGSSPAAATKIFPESFDSGKILLIFGTFGLCSFLDFFLDPNHDPYGETSGNYWRAPERILPIVLAASFFAEVVTWV